MGGRREGQMGGWKKQWRGVGGGWGFLEKSLSFPPTRQYFELQRKIKNDFYESEQLF